MQISMTSQSLVMTSSLLLEGPEHDGDHAEVAGVDEVDRPLAVVRADLAVGALEEKVSGKGRERFPFKYFQFHSYSWEKYGPERNYLILSTN